MKKITYILIVLMLLFNSTIINVLAEEVDKTIIEQKRFDQAIKNNDVTVNNNEDDDFAELDAIIGDNEVSDEELKEIKGNLGPIGIGIIVGITVYTCTKVVDDAVKEATGKSIGGWIGYSIKKSITNSKKYTPKGSIKPQPGLSGL